MLVANNLISLAKNADFFLKNGKWIEALECYSKIDQIESNSPSVKHNIALCNFALNKLMPAELFAKQAINLNNNFYQSYILLSKINKLNGHINNSLIYLNQVIGFDSQNAEALIALADLMLNEFGDPLVATQLVSTLLNNPTYGEDAKLISLMAALYDREETSDELNQKIINFSRASMQLPEIYNHPENKTLKKHRRIGLISPMFSASPVYFLTISFFRKLSKHAELIFFDRGFKRDWATTGFKDIAKEWFDLTNLSAEDIAYFIYQQNLDVLYDLGGWIDPVALKALSAKPAKIQYKWVGGQSVTSGLNCFDGWIGDNFQSPLNLQYLYTEKLLNIKNDYVKYTPPNYLPTRTDRKLSGYAIFANPAKLSREFLRKISLIPGKKCFIHRQYAHELVRFRIESVLNKNEIEYIFPQSHQEALEALNRFETVLDTFPYTSGLTAREAAAMGLKVDVLQTGKLFCERHTARLL